LEVVGAGIPERLGHLETGSTDALLRKLGKPSPGQIFIRCLERAFYLLAVNRKPSEISAVTVSVETFADF